MATGHPRHQIREFTITVKHSTGLPYKLRVKAQTEHDALLRAGLELATHTLSTEDGQWIVTGVHDPAPTTYVPSESSR